MSVCRKKRRRSKKRESNNKNVDEREPLLNSVIIGITPKITYPIELFPLCVGFGFEYALHSYLPLPYSFFFCMLSGQIGVLWRIRRGILYMSMTIRKNIFFLPTACHVSSTHSLLLITLKAAQSIHVYLFKLFGCFRHDYIWLNGFFIWRMSVYFLSSSLFVSLSLSLVLEWCACERYVQI